MFRRVQRWLSRGHVFCGIAKDRASDRGCLAAADAQVEIDRHDKGRVIVWRESREPGVLVLLSGGLVDWAELGRAGLTADDDTADVREDTGSAVEID